MDLNEAAERIFKYHWVLILLTTIIGLSVPIALAQRQDDAYVASARIDMGAEDTRDSEEANGLADAALAVATSPGVLATALETAGVPGDQPDTLVRVDPVGASGVLQVSVTHPEAEASAKIANALAEAVIAQRVESKLGDITTLRDSVTAQIEAVTARVQELALQQEAAAAAADRRIAAGLEPGPDLTVISDRYQQALDQLTSLTEQQQELSAALAAEGNPRVVDASSTEGTLVETSVPARVAAGGLLGLILGIALAATLEAWRPTLGPAALARHLGVPLLGSLRRLPRTAADLPDHWLSSYVALAADNARVRSYELVSVGPEVDVSGLARSLAAQADAGSDVVPLDLAGSRGQVPSADARAGTGIIVVAPKRVKSAWLTNLERHVALTRQPVIGVITYSHGGRAPRQGTPAPAPAQAQAPARDSAPAQASSAAYAPPPAPASSAAYAPPPPQAAAPAQAPPPPPPSRSGLKPQDAATNPATS